LAYEERYLEALRPWLPALERELYRCPDRPELVCYGTGYNGWGVQTHQKAFAAAAVLAASGSTEGKSGELRETALAMLRFNLETHASGGYRCTDGTKWGHTWISALGIERMMHGVEAIRESLTETDAASVRRVLLSEADWLLDHYSVVGGLYDKLDGQSRNKPESNLWNGALLHRAAALYPDAARAEEYRDKGTRFLLNGVSVPDDALSERIVAGKPLSQWHEGANFFPTYALNHHNYLNVGYMVICLSNIAMLHFYGMQAKLPAPEALYHRAEALWSLVKELTFPDGRLLRIGGDTRVPYCYCQDYAIPMWLLAEDVFGADCSGFEEGWLAQVRTEAGDNPDGGYLSGRLKELEHRSPMYYTRLESDRAAALSMGACWRPLAKQRTKAGDGAESPGRERIEAEPAQFFWSDEAHGASLLRSRRRIVSWVWQAADRPTGLCLPPSASHLAEWRWNLAGRIAGIGARNVNEIRGWRMDAFTGGFATIGAMETVSSGFVAEGQAAETIADHRIAFVALPDDRTAAVMQLATAVPRAYVAELRGLHLQVPNDAYNGYERRYAAQRGVWTEDGRDPEERHEPLEGGWLNVDGKLGVVRAYGPQLGLYFPGGRNVHLKQYPWTDKSTDIGLLRTEQVVQEFVRGRRVYDSGERMLDNGFCVLSGTGAEETRQAAARTGAVPIETQGEAVRALRASGADGTDYLLIVNFGDEAAEAELRCGLLPEPIGVKGQRQEATRTGARYELEPLSIGVYKWREAGEENTQ